MQVKRKFEPGSVDAGEPRVSHLEIKTGPEVGDLQKFSPRVIQRGIVEGWLTFGDGKATIKTAPDLPDMELEVVAGPGLRCCHCDAELTDEKSAREHVIDEHGSRSEKAFLLQVLVDDVDEGGAPVKRVEREGNVKESPDPENPAGYRQDNFFSLRRTK